MESIMERRIETDLELQLLSNFSSITDLFLVNEKNGTEQDEGEGTTGGSSFNFYKIVAIPIGFFSIFINAWIFHAIKHRNRRGYPSKYAQINSIASSVIMVVISIVNVLQEHSTVQFSHWYWFCKMWPACGRASMTLSSLTVLEIFIEIALPTSRKFGHYGIGNGNRFLQKIFGPFQTFFCTWIITLILSLPTSATYEIVQGFTNINNTTSSEFHGSVMCDKVYIFGYPELSIFYEVTWSICVAFLPSIVMAYVLYSWRFRFQYLFLCKKIPQGMQHQVRRIRLAFIHTSTFILMWVPLGILLPFRRSTTSSMNSRAYETSQTSVLIALRIFFCIQMSLQPTLFVYAHFGLTVPTALKKFLEPLQSILLRRRRKDRRKITYRNGAISISCLLMETVNPTIHVLHKCSSDRKNEILETV